MSAREFLVIGIVLAFGVATARELLLTYRWDPSLFRNGITVFRRSVPLPSDAQVPEPKAESHFISAARVDSRRLGPHEVLFVAPQLTWAAMRGRLRYLPDVGELEVRGQLNWASSGLWACMALLDWRMGAAVVALVAWGYLAERRRFATILQDAAALMRS